jgi:16S rRNA (cytosine1402-N4)-methyltransferase
MPVHVPVMAGEVVDYLVPSRGGVFVDCTVGAGGHCRALLEAGAGRIVGIDRDTDALEVARAELAPWRDAVVLVHGDFRDLAAILDGFGIDTVEGIVADLGLSSLQLEREGRGFSFLRDEPLDMRMDRTAGKTAAGLLREASETELADVIYRYGEERYSRRIARAISEARRAKPIVTTGELASIVRRAVGRRRERIDPATRTFQALRIWVNRELDHLDVFIVEACSRLRRGGRLAVISFHSLEDRVVKHTLRGLAAHQDSEVRVLTKKPVVPSDEELGRNPRSRSAKLRVAERIA